MISDNRVLYTEIESWLRRLKMNYEFLARLLGVEESEVRQYARTLPVPVGLILLFKLADTEPRFEFFTKSHHLHEAWKDKRLAPHEILGVDAGDLNAAGGATLELLHYYEGDEFLERKITAAYEAMKILAGEYNCAEHAK